MSHVQVIQNVSTKQVLTWNGSSVTMHMNTTDASKYIRIVNNILLVVDQYTYDYIYMGGINSVTD